MVPRWYELHLAAEVGMVLAYALGAAVPVDAFAIVGSLGVVALADVTFDPEEDAMELDWPRVVLGVTVLVVVAVIVFAVWRG